MTELVTAIKKMANKGMNGISNAEVLEVYKNKNTCDVKVLKTGEELYDVVLQSIAGNYQRPIVAYPVKGSTVTIAYFGISGDAAIVVETTEVDEVLIGGNEFGGLVKVEALTQELAKNNEILTSIMNIINAAPIPEPGNGAVSAFQAALKGALIGLNVGNFSEIANEKVKHG